MNKAFLLFVIILLNVYPMACFKWGASTPTQLSSSRAVIASEYITFLDCADKIEKEDVVKKNIAAKKESLKTFVDTNNKFTEDGQTLMDFTKRYPTCPSP
ncbi:MAG: hypothetical protein AABZ74_02980 [Cyanobacteriota bacterium]